MWWLFNKKQPRMVGVDISPTSVKLLELSQHNEHFRIESYAVAPLVPDAMMESDIKLMKKDIDLLKAGHEVLKQEE